MSEQPTQQFDAVPQPLPPRGRGHTWRVVLVAVLTALAVLTPIAVYLVLHRAGTETPAPGEAAPSPPAASAPSPSRSSSPPSSHAVDGRISLETLKNATLDIPPWPADNVRGPSGRLHFHNGAVQIPGGGYITPGEPPTGVEIVLLGAAYGDVDRDGADETVAELGCMIEGGSQQVVVFDRDSSGRIVTMGQVVATTGEIRNIRTGSERIGDNGVVTVRVSDYQRSGDDRTPQTWQDRGYRRTNGRFEQVSGPTRMTANPYVTETSLSTGELVLGPVVDGYRYGTLTVTIEHGWGTRPGRILLSFYTGNGLEPTGSAWPTATPHGAGSFVVFVAPPPARGGTHYTFAFRRPAAVGGGTLDLEVNGANAAGSTLSEANPWNNGSTVPIRVVD